MENLSDKSFIPSNQGRVNEEMIPQGRSGIPGSQDLICIDLSRQIALPNNMMVSQYLQWKHLDYFVLADVEHSHFVESIPHSPVTLLATSTASITILRIRPNSSFLIIPKPYIPVDHVVVTFSSPLFSKQQPKC
ncbi:hypothetical protein TNCV_80541 [Trichonephila clavipes]|nr:hypothetical protein TNCV_80541 [Trichonephila clavipes]